MRLFGGRSAGGDEAAKEAARAEESLRRVQDGQLPMEAQSRLQAVQGSPSSWTSTLAVGDLLLAKELGVKPLGVVQGASVYHVGLAGLRQGGYFWQSGELGVLSQAHLAARELALQRLGAEAQALGAHGVVGVHLEGVSYDFAEDLVSFRAFGTAVRLEAAKDQGDMFFGNVTLQEFYKLLRIGQMPVGLVLGVCSYYVVSDWLGMMQSMSFYNQEMASLTEGTYTARHLSMRRMESQAKEMGAAGVVGVDVRMNVQSLEVSEGRTDHIVHFVTVGSAVRGEHRPPLGRVETQLDLREASN